MHFFFSHCTGHHLNFGRAISTHFIGIALYPEGKARFANQTTVFRLKARLMLGGIEHHFKPRTFNVAAAWNKSRSVDNPNVLQLTIAPDRN
jgi:hypothetical protein